MPGRAPPARFPSVHPFAAVGILVRNEGSSTGLQEVLLFREEFIVREDGGAADAGGCQINQASRRRYCWISRAHLNCRDRCCKPMEKRAAEHDTSQQRQR